MTNAFIMAVAGGVLFMLGLIMIPIVAILTMHRRRMEEIRMKGRIAVAEETRAAIEALRQEFNALRDTTTQYDVSFDTALHRIESRVGNVEQRLQQVENHQRSDRYSVQGENVRAIQ